MSANHRERSVSGDLEDSDVGSPLEPGESASNAPAGKPGRKKNPNSQAARRDQNRIAQREFRLRKQQRIRDLEASVEILSGGKDEALTQLRKMMKDLMQENQVLRNLLRGLSSFIGDGAGGLLPKLGWDMNDFNNFLNRSETDTAWESYQRHKREEGAAGSSTGPSQANAGQKRTTDDDLLYPRSKRPRGVSESNGDSIQLMSSSSSHLGSNGIYGASSRSTHDNALFSELLRGSTGSSVFGQSPSPVTAQYGPSGSNNVGGYGTSYLPPMNINADTSLPSMPLVSSSTLPLPQATKVPSRQRAQTVSDEPDEEPKRNEAYKLIHYHLDNFRRNSAYCLPSSIRPTLVQRSIPHEQFIDGIPHPELRDRMILKRNQFDIVDCLHDYRHSVTIHGDDVLGHQNWELSESWLKQYSMLVGHETLEICNRWRKERGEPALSPEDIGISDLAEFASPNTMG